MCGGGEEGESGVGWGERVQRLHSITIWGVGSGFRGFTPSLWGVMGSEVSFHHHAGGGHGLRGFTPLLWRWVMGSEALLHHHGVGGHELRGLTPSL